jgi:PAS domain S-box-containing protein
MSKESITSWWRKHKSKHKTVFTEFKSPLSNRWYIISTSPFRGNKFVTTFRDITERKLTEEKIRIASQYARTLIEASLDPLVTISSEGKITDVNIATEKVTGFKREKLIGSEFADYFVESEKAREAYNIVFSKGVVKDYPLTIRHKNGRITDVLYNATLFKNDEGAVQGVFAAARDITLRKKMEIRLKNSKKLLEKLNQHLNEIREKERSEIALNLHDDLGQRLTAICLDIAWLKSRIGVQSNPVRKKLDEMIHEINETIEGIKELSSFLRPAMLYDLGLVPAIISQLNKFENQSGIKCSFYFDSEDFNSDEKISLIFFRIIQESLTNIARHSGASALELSLKKLENAIEMSIKDNGVGIDHEKVNSMTSMGLEGIRERVKSVHGEVTIKGDKGSGTSIIVTIPVKMRRK